MVTPTSIERHNDGALSIGQQILSAFTLARVLILIVSLIFQTSGQETIKEHSFLRQTSESTYWTLTKSRIGYVVSYHFLQE